MATGTQQKKVSEYNQVFDEKNIEKRLKKAQNVTDNFYDLITKFYEKGWGDSFHFAPRHKGESFKASIVRHEHFLAAKLGLNEKDNVLDVGCGIMGPARNIARLTGAHITGLTINQYQVDRANELNGKAGLDHLLEAHQGDYMDIPWPDNTFDKMYAIESLCHAPDLLGVYKQILKKLKPGGKAAFYQWAMNDKYDPANLEHKRIKEDVEYGNSICKLYTTAEINKKLEEAGFVLEETTDLTQTNLGNDVPWYSTLKSGWSLKQIRQTKASRNIMKGIFTVSEAIGLVKKGVVKTQKILLVAADSLVQAGEKGIFTPMYLIIVSKPED